MHPSCIGTLNLNHSPSHSSSGLRKSEKCEHWNVHWHWQCRAINQQPVTAAAAGAGDGGE